MLVAINKGHTGEEIFPVCLLFEIIFYCADVKTEILAFLQQTDTE